MADLRNLSVEDVKQRAQATPPIEEQGGQEASLSQYDVLAIPLSAIDVENPGELFKAEATGSRDLQARERWAELLTAGYRVHSFSINNNAMYILFQK